MLQKYAVVSVLFGSVLASLPAVAQEYAPDRSEISFEASLPLAASTNANGDNGSVGVKNNSDEVMAAYIFRFQAKRWSPFLLAGAGGLIFDPGTVAGASSQARVGYLYSGGADFNLKKQILDRTEYRGVFYSSPTFNLNVLNPLDRYTQRAEPSFGFGYKF